MTKSNQAHSLVTSLLRRIAVPLSVIILLVMIWQIPQRQTSGLGLSGKERADVENAYRQTLLQAIGGLFFFVTAYFSWRNLQTTEKNYRISEDKQITERFSKAVEMLGNKDLIEVRLGGIYILARIARDSPEDHWTVMEVLTAFVRKGPRSQELNSEDISSVSEELTIIPTDIQAALNMIGEREISNDPPEKYLDFSGAKLNGANLKKFRLDGANLNGVELNGADLSEAHLNGAVFDGAKLNKACFERAYLNGASFGDASLERANLDGAYLEGASLCADLTGAYFRESHLNGAYFVGAFLTRAFLNKAELNGANFEEALLDKADLREAHLNGANFFRAELSEAYPNLADLTEANFREAYLNRAFLGGANLCGANLNGADLREANLEGANLNGADLGGAKLDGAELKDADLSKARNWTNKQLGTAALLWNTQLPEGCDLDKDRNCPKWAREADPPASSES